MRFRNFIDQYNAGVGIAVLDCLLNPVDDKRIDQIVSPVITVNMGEQNHFVTRLDPGAMIKEVVYGNSRPFGHSYQFTQGGAFLFV